MLKGMDMETWHNFDMSLFSATFNVYLLQVYVHVTIAQPSPMGMVKVMKPV